MAVVLFLVGHATFLPPMRWNATGCHRIGFCLGSLPGIVLLLPGRIGDAGRHARPPVIHTQSNEIFCVTKIGNN